MNQVCEIDGHTIDNKDLDRVVNSIIDVLSKEKITYAIAYMILEEVRKELENTIFKKST